MFMKLVILAFIVAATSAFGQEDGEWHGHQNSYNRHDLNNGAYTGDGDYHGEGLTESGANGQSASEYHYAGNNDGQWYGDNGHHGVYNNEALNTGDGEYHGEGLAESGALGDQYSHNGGHYYDHLNAYNHHGLNSGAYTGDGDYHGEGLAESGAFGPVHQGAAVHAGAYGHQGYAGVGHAVQLPAGVDAHACPNYPYCH